MSLIETRAEYMQRLQSLIDARQNSIDEKVAALRAKLEAEEIQPYRAQLEAEKVTPEISKLVEFINDIDEMLAYDSGEKVEQTEQTEQTEQVEQVEQVEQTEDVVEKVEDEQTEQTESVVEKVEDESFRDGPCTDSTGDNINAVEHHTVEAKPDTTLDGTVFEAIAADIADTKAKLQSVSEGRPGMPGIVLPRR